MIDKKIIRYSGYDSRYKIFEGSDLDIELAIDQAGQLVERVKNITTYLEDYFDFPIIPAKEVSYRFGTPRFFSFILSEGPIGNQPEEEIDGFINLVFNNKLKEKELRSHSQNCPEAILFGYFKKSSKN
ncbi:MAG: hypothetical protein U5Q03_01555 [Bacteroidota bacterium]|nr:hypothetical protein [Bacteroidota bacterium]